MRYQFLATLDWEVLKVACFCSDTMFLPPTPAQTKALPLLPRTRVMLPTVPQPGSREDATVPTSDHTKDSIQTSQQTGETGNRSWYCTVATVSLLPCPLALHAWASIVNGSHGLQGNACIQTTVV